MFENAPEVTGLVRPLKAMPRDRREALTPRQVYSCGDREINARLGIPEHAVANRLIHALYLPAQAADIRKRPFSPNTLGILLHGLRSRVVRT